MTKDRKPITNKDKDDFLAKIPCSLKEFANFFSEEFAECEVIARLVERDGYVKIRQTNTDVDVLMTELGIEFFLNGGYVGEHKREQTSKWENRGWLVVGGAIVDILKNALFSAVPISGSGTGNRKNKND